MGLGCLTKEARVLLYWTLAFVSFVVGFAAILTENYPGGTVKPWQLLVFDSCVTVLESVIMVAEATPSGYSGRYYILVGVVAFAARVYQAHLIKAHVIPYNSVQNNKNRFNAAGPAKTHAVSSIYSVITRPASGTRNTIYGEPFYELRNRGELISNQERASLLAVIETV